MRAVGPQIRYEKFSAQPRCRASRPPMPPSFSDLQRVQVEERLVMLDRPATGDVSEYAHNDRHSRDDGQLPSARRHCPLTGEPWQDHQRREQCVECDTLTDRWLYHPAITSAVARSAAAHAPPADRRKHDKQRDGKGKQNSRGNEENQRDTEARLEGSDGSHSRIDQVIRNPANAKEMTG